MNNQLAKKDNIATAFLSSVISIIASQVLQVVYPKLVRNFTTLELMLLTVLLIGGTYFLLRYFQHSRVERKQQEEERIKRIVQESVLDELKRNKKDEL